ncbi:Haze protective factor 1 [Streptomyces lunaelactis]|uniref:Haze protective factor 1 n=1 Tax=Streptomyces lunaelactis TaxID=1535768 RepID=UPI00131F15FB|nr:Haze protective factor 1 [Streptomyces lunaelactis]NUK24041.1 Haze protective factor 1 [Streptomyces lunaelactis]NUK52299.1 Haze protective factor 1 [Streptomyces lunaelactis]NUK63966.1 Haze protective factor 1 [Streptomyces lunaelactis]NUK85707.1 Haze protective factor 1 [Streptomyces lunaelactis]
MAGDETVRVSGTVSVDRSIFGLDELRREGEEPRAFWTDLPMEGPPLVVGAGVARVLSKAQSHDVSVAVEVRSGRPEGPGEGFELLGSWRYQTGSGEQMVCTMDGPALTFRLREDSGYVLQVWCRGGDTAAARFEELMGQVFPITDLEEYLFVFTPDG